MSRIPILLLVIQLAFAGPVPSPAEGQSTSTGALAGAFSNEDGQALGDVQIALTPVDGGLAQLAETGSDGTFLLQLLEPGEYTLLAELLGYGPLLVTNIVILPGRRVDVVASLTPVEGVVQAPDTVPFSGAALASGSLAASSQSFGPWALRSLPQRDAGLHELGRFSSFGDGSLAAEGLPGRLGGLIVQGLPFRAAESVGGSGLPVSLLFPTQAAGRAELLVGRSDVELPGAAGALMEGGSRPVATGFGGAVTGIFEGEDLVLDAEQHGAEPGSMARAGARLQGSMAGDSATAFLFAEGQARSVPVRFWPRGAGGLANGLSGVGLDVSHLNASDASPTTRLSLGSGFTWSFSGGESVEVLTLYGLADQDHATSTLFGHEIPARVEGEDLLAAGRATTYLGESLVLEVRAGFTLSSRELRDTTSLETGLGGAALAFAPRIAQLGDPWLPEALTRSALSGQATLHFHSGDHRLKAGLGGHLIEHEQTRRYPGLYLFESAEHYRDRVGVFQGLEGGAETAAFSVNELFVYGQDTWRVAAGLDLTTGFRYELETLPASDVRPASRWRELTGLDNRSIPDQTGDVSVVAGFDWNVQERYRWRVRGGLSMHRGDVAPELLAEALTHDGRLTATTAIGDATTVTEVGPRLTLLSPGFRPPMTTRVSLGISRALGETSALHLGAVFRQTDNLPQRSDLNLPTEAPLRDQYGRPLFGELVREGSLLVPVPSGNRRFGEFDAVSAVSSGASSTYWGLTARLEKKLGRSFKALASYTHSRTEDDWLGAAGGPPLDALAPFPGIDDLEGWVEGVSDLDIPHRLSVATEWRLPFADAVSLGGVWQWSSGRPFTPGFGRGIDANADGVAGNDPAYVDGSLPGMEALQAQWPCLREYEGQFVARNACRAYDRTLLDLWLGWTLPIAGVRPQLRVEALALDHEGMGVLETALYQLDPAGDLTVDSGTGTVNVPLQVNPRFGRGLQPSPELARIRISFSMEF